MNVSTRARAQTADSAKPATQPIRQESAGPQLAAKPRTAATTPISAGPDLAVVHHESSSGEGDGDGDGDGPVVSIPAQNIRKFKEAVVNTSRLLKVFGEHEKELIKSKQEVARLNEDAKRAQSAQHALQREVDTRSRDLIKANAETDSARSLLLQREEELSRVRGLKEDLEARVAELRRAEPALDRHAAPPKSPNVAILEEVERLKKEVEAKEGSLKSLRISRDSIRSSTKAEVMSIQAKYAREQRDLIYKLEKEKKDHEMSLAAKEAELEQEQERLVQEEMELNMRTTQLEDQAADLKAKLEDMTTKYNSSQLELKRLEEQAKGRHSEDRAETLRLQRASKKSEKQIAELEAALQKATSQAKEAVRESARAKAKHRPKSTATAADAVSAATEDLAEMDLDELRNEVITLRTDAVHKDETIRRQGVLVEELERKQNPEGRKSRGRTAVLQAEIDDLTDQMAVRDKKIEALEAALHIPKDSSDSAAEGSTDMAGAKIAQLDLKLISVEATLKEKEQRIASLERELREAAAAVSERPMRLRQPAPARSPSVQAARQALVNSPGRAISLRNDSQQQQQQQQTDIARGKQSRARVDLPLDSQNEALYSEIAALRARVAKLQQERAALQELVTEQQVNIRRLRGGPGSGDLPAQQLPAQRVRPLAPPLAPMSAPALMSGSVQRKRVQLADSLDEVEETGVVVSKRPKNSSGMHFESATKMAVAASSRRSLARLLADPSGDSDVEAIEKLLRDKRISGANRIKRFMSFAQKSPQLVLAALLGMADDLPTIDAAELSRALPSILSSKPGAKADSSAAHRTAPSKEAPSVFSHANIRELFAPRHSLGAADSLPQGLYNDEAAVALLVWALCLRSSQDDFFSSFMLQLSRSIIAPPPGLALAMTCALARVFAILSLLADDVQRVRVLLCDLLMDAVDGPHLLPVLANALAVWPRALAMPADSDDGALSASSSARSSLGLIIRAFQAVVSGIHDLYAEEHGKDEADELYSVMTEHCGWRRPSDAEFADRIMVEVSEVLKGLEHDSPSYPIVLCAHSILAPYVSS
ncbi:hypothetical protein GGI18_000049 [Coemansia linderi]|uniref:Uncharacterized protein n=1 Tax=Coemansia linderi TaxID=2663919 RepID=A0ACC1KQ50_9FUNG|nr:hypothetical protein GGI18_000049 [Coemansia linderi]